ncbi:gluconokinase [Fervidobacterium gondwanense]|uniref:Gluconokinase n=1 Tax=Fervidobacterium gondwanense DSM 13020 TaxID=1121883 RepID=A0A1M7RS26_FERGO|nr:FGGY family carbohydrate kinase [Fervidobacterium gondwanense]SHN49059.1 gluconokinase [Fervidobacterium gondwanense DSM 13020]
MAQDLILAIDLGTSYLKVGLIDQKGKILKSERKRLKLITDSFGKAEHDVNALSKLLLKTTKKVIEGYENRIAAIVPSTYIFGIMAADSNGKPLTNLITLLDTRSRVVHNDFLGIFDPDEIYYRSGMPPTFHSSLYKVFWLRKTFEELRRNDVLFLSSKDFVIYLLSGKFLSDESTASSTGYFNTHKLDWDDEILQKVGITRDNLSTIVPAPELIPVANEVRSFLKLKNNVKVVAGLYDGGAVALASGVFDEKKKAIMNLGTTAMLRVAYDKPVIGKGEIVSCQTLYLCNGNWFIGGSVNNAGSVVAWLKTLMGPRSIDIEDVVVEDNLLFFPYLTGERGFSFGSNSHGVIYGLEQRHSKRDVVLAGLEGVAFTLRSMADEMRGYGVSFSKVVASGGGTKFGIWMKVLANVLKTEIEILQIDEPALVGSALLGSAALGWSEGISSAYRYMESVRISVEPDEYLVEKYDVKYDRFLEILKTLYLRK